MAAKRKIKPAAKRKRSSSPKKKTQKQTGFQKWWKRWCSI